MKKTPFSPFSDPLFRRALINRWTGIHIICLLIGMSFLYSGITGFFISETARPAATVVEKSRTDDGFEITITTGLDGKTVTSTQGVSFSKWLKLDTGRAYPFALKDGAPVLVFDDTPPGLSVESPIFAYILPGLLFLWFGFRAVRGSVESALAHAALEHVAERAEATIITLERRLSGPPLFFFPNVRILYVFSPGDDGRKTNGRTKLMFEGTAKRLCEDKNPVVLHDPEGALPPRLDGEPPFALPEMFVRDPHNTMKETDSFPDIHGC